MIRTGTKLLPIRTKSSSDIDIDLDSPFLRSILSDERPTLEFRGFTSPVVTAHTEMSNREPTEEEWSNRQICDERACDKFLTISNYS